MMMTMIKITPVLTVLVLVATQLVAYVTATTPATPTTPAADVNGQLPQGWTFPSSSSSTTTTTTTAVVTGGTKGIGKAIVEGLAQHPSQGGCRVFTCSRNYEELQQCLEEWHAKGYDVHGVQADVSTPVGRDQLMTKIRQWLSKDQSKDQDQDQDSSSDNLRLDILVNNVGTNIRKPSIDYTPEEIAAVWNTNYHSMFDLTMKCYPLLKNRRRPSEDDNSKNGNESSEKIQKTGTTSSVVMISSVAGVTCMKSGTPYASTKAAMNQLCGNLACEWGPSGIRVNCVAPWYINTPLAEQVLKNPEYRKSVLDVTPLGRVGESEEVAGIVVFLCLPIADWITGQVISVDGGFTRQGYYDSFFRG
mmetsp:Transcript_15950/g.39518  ORF Transcript_15950/g.39518 Transcript_15950/m.39518 type:complete len:361 (+) Transcript_15950:65-1147(+)